MAAEPGARAPAFGRGSSSSSLPAAPTGAASPSDRKLAMQPLPDPPGAASPSPSGGAKEAQPEVPPEWQQSLANMREAASAAEALRDLVADAVFLDEEAFTSASTMDVYQSTIKVRCPEAGPAPCRRRSAPPTAVATVSAAPRRIDVIAAVT